MDSTEQSELLIAIKTRLDTLISQFDKVSNGVGFPRCAKRGQLIEALCRRVEILENHNTWLWRTLVGLLVCIAVSLIKTHFMGGV